MRLNAFAKQILPLLLVLSLLLPPLSGAADKAPAAGLPATLYIVPFLNAMVPGPFSEQLFETFVDAATSAAAPHRIKVRILKRDIDTVDREWLAAQHFVTGETFGYAEEGGCCSTAIAATARIYRFQPGTADPVGEFVVADEAFFDHDVATVEQERLALADRIARKLATQLIAGFVPAP